MGIKYVHIKELAPSKELRGLQKRHDEHVGVTKTLRQTLSEEFVAVYKRDYLERLSLNELEQKIGIEAKVVALFCVEANPKACHRSIVSQWIREGLEIPCKDVTKTGS